MSRPCTICSLPDQRRRKVERQLMAENNTAVSVATGLSRFALARHRKHMGAAMAAAYFFVAAFQNCLKLGDSQVTMTRLTIADEK